MVTGHELAIEIARRASQPVIGETRAKLGAVRELLDVICQDSLEVTLAATLANREWSMKQEVSSRFVQASDALGEIEESLLRMDLRCGHPSPTTDESCGLKLGHGGAKHLSVEGGEWKAIT